MPLTVGLIRRHCPPSPERNAGGTPGACESAQRAPCHFHSVSSKGSSPLSHPTHRGPSYPLPHWPPSPGRTTARGTPVAYQHEGTDISSTSLSPLKTPTSSLGPLSPGRTTAGAHQGNASTRRCVREDNATDGTPRECHWEEGKGKGIWHGSTEEWHASAQHTRGMPAQVRKRVG